MGMLEKGYVWITTSLITDLLYTLNSSTFSLMEGVVGIGSFYPDTGPQFDDFTTKFQKKFKADQPEEESNTPGVFAVQAYDATWTVGLSLSKNNTRVQKLAASRIYQIVNVIGKYYRGLGFWSEGLGFSEVVNDDKSIYDTSLQSLGYIFWPGRPLHTPRGFAISTNANPLRVGVPIMAMFKKFVEVKYDHEHHNLSYKGYSIELFKETIKRLPYDLPYEFHPVNGTYDNLVKQVYLKKFDIIVGDVSVVPWRYKYAEFTHPYTESGLVMIVPVTLYHEAWLFVKPFTLSMWTLTILINVYNAFVIWVIEHKNNPEIGGSALNRTGSLLSIAFTRMFFTNGIDS